MVATHPGHERFQVLSDSIHSPVDLGQRLLIPNCKVGEDAQGINCPLGIAERIQSVDEFPFFVVHNRRVGVKY